MSTSELDISAVIGGYLSLYKEVQRLLVRTRRAKAAGDRRKAVALFKRAQEVLQRLESYEAAHRPTENGPKTLAS